MRLAERQRPTGWQVAVGLVVAATLVRLAYGLLVNDPFSGPDAATYDATGRIFADRGFGTDICDLVERRTGYMMFIGAVYAVAGDAPRVYVAVQVLLIGLAAFSAFSLTRRELGERVGLVALALLLVSPAALASGTELMYEPLLGAGLVVGVDLVSRGLEPGARHRWWLAAAGGAALGFAYGAHPKALVVVAPLLVLLVLRRRPAIGLVLACVAGLLVVPTAVAVRAQVATGSPRIANQLGLSLVGIDNPSRKGKANCVSAFGQIQPAASPEEQGRVPKPPKPAGPARQSKLDRLTVRGLVARLPGRLRDYWGPMVLPAELDHGLWFHAFTPERLAPGGLRQEPAFQSAIEAVEVAWSAVGALLVLLGAVLVCRRPERRRSRVLLLVAPTALVLAVSLLTVAEARFRLPAASFYVPLQAVALVGLLDRARQRRWPSGAGRGGARAPAADGPTPGVDRIGSRPS